MFGYTMTLQIIDGSVKHALVIDMDTVYRIHIYGIGGPVNARVRSPHRKTQAEERAIRERMRNKDIGNYFILMLTLSWVGL